MFLKTSLSILAIASLLLGAGPAQQDDPKQTLMQIYENEMQNYQSWPIVPGSEVKMPGKGAHGKFITTFANELAMQAINENAEAMPDGSILVKDNFHTPEDEAPWSAVMMKKVDGEWFYGVFFPPYEAKMAGFPVEGTPANKVCLSCHVKAPNDKVFLWQKK